MVWLSPRKWGIQTIILPCFRTNLFLLTGAFSWVTPAPSTLGFDAAEEEVKILHQTVGHQSCILPILIEHP